MTLTPRETEVYRLLMSGKRGPECAAELGIKLGTWKVYASRVYQKMRVRSRLELIDRQSADREMFPKSFLIPCAEYFAECDYTFQ